MGEKVAWAWGMGVACGAWWQVEPLGALVVGIRRCGEVRHDVDCFLTGLDLTGEDMYRILFYHH
jgi:hypothetical protein